MKLSYYMYSTRKHVLYLEPEIIVPQPAHNHFAAWYVTKNRRGKNKTKGHELKMILFSLPKNTASVSKANNYKSPSKRRWGRQAECPEAYKHKHCHRTHITHGCHRANSVLPQCVGPSFLFALGCLLLPLTSSILGLVQFLGASVQLSNPKGLFLLSEFAVFLVSLAGTWIVLTHETLGGNRAAHPCSRMCFHSLFPFPQHSVFLLPFHGSITQPLWANSLC